MNPDERENLLSILPVLTILSLDDWFKSIEVSTKLKNTDDYIDAVGIWDPQIEKIVIRRDQLSFRETLFGLILHEIAHATSLCSDCSRGFESALTDIIGELALIVQEFLSRNDIE